MGFVATIAGIGVLPRDGEGFTQRLGVRTRTAVDRPGVGVMPTPSVDVVQSAFPEELQCEISGLSRSVSNLDSSPGAAVASTILVSGIGDKSYAAAMIVLACIGIAGLVATMSIPTQGVHAVASRSTP